MAVMADKPAGDTAIRPFTIETPEADLDDLRRTHRGDALADQGARRRSLAGRATRHDAGARPLLDDRVRLAQVRGETERAGAVHDRDRRGGHPLHPRALAARGRAAADHDPRLARLGRRAARDRRPADRPDRARRRRRGRVPPGLAVDTRLRLLGSAGRSRLGRGSHWASLGGADEAPRLRPLCRPGRRPGSRRHRRDGPPGARGPARRPHQRAHPARSPRESCRRSPSRIVRRTTRSRRSRRTASATSWRWPPGRRRSATRCWTHPSPSRRGCSTTTRTATTSSRAPSWTTGRPATSPGTTSSTTSRCTG